MITRTDPAFPPCGRAPYNHICRQDKKTHGWFVDERLYGKTASPATIYPPWRRAARPDKRSSPGGGCGSLSLRPLGCR